MPGPLISKSQSGRVNIRTTQQIGRTWTERYLVNVRSVNGRALLAFIDNVWRNGTTFTIDHRDHLTPLGTGGGSPLINQPAQLVIDPENFNNWTPSGTIARTGGQTDPYGTTNAYLLDSNLGATDRILQNVAFTGNATKAAMWHMRAGTSTASRFLFFDNTAAVVRYQINIAWAGGVPTPSAGGGSGTLFPVVNLGGGWYAFAAAGDNIIAANTNQLFIYPDTAAGLGTVNLFGVNAWNNSVPAGYIGPSHLTATGSTLYIDGATASVSNWLRAGDIVSVAGLSPVYEVTADTASLAGGYVPLPVNPPIFVGAAPSDNALVTITGVTLTACILEPPTYPTTSGPSVDYGEVSVHFSESL